MMEDTDQCNKKIELMRKYIPLLSKLIIQLEEAFGSTPEGIKNITKLKILLQQLSNPKPGIPLDELIKCEEVLETLFDSEEDTPYHSTEGTTTVNTEIVIEPNSSDKSCLKSQENIKEFQNEDKKHSKSEEKHQNYKSETEQQKLKKIAEKNGKEKQNLDKESRNFIQENVKNLETLLDNNTKSLESQTADEESPPIEEESSNALINRAGEETNQNVRNTSISSEDSEEVKTKLKTIVNVNEDHPIDELDENHLEGEIEIIEFSDTELEGELILPDDASPFFQQYYNANDNQDDRDSDEGCTENLETETIGERNHIKTCTNSQLKKDDGNKESEPTKSMTVEILTNVNQEVMEAAINKEPFHTNNILENVLTTEDNNQNIHNTNEGVDKKQDTTESTAKNMEQTKPSGQPKLPIETQKIGKSKPDNTVKNQQKRPDNEIASDSTVKKQNIISKTVVNKQQTKPSGQPKLPIQTQKIKKSMPDNVAHNEEKRPGNEIASDSTAKKQSIIERTVVNKAQTKPVSHPKLPIETQRIEKSVPGDIANNKEKRPGNEIASDSIAKKQNIIERSIVNHQQTKPSGQPKLPIETQKIEKSTPDYTVKTKEKRPGNEIASDSTAKKQSIIERTVVNHQQTKPSGQPKLPIETKKIEKSTPDYTVKTKEKRPGNEIAIDSTAKKQKLSNTVDLTEDIIVDDPFLVDIIKIETEKANDDVEIIEEINSPILIDSDEEDELFLLKPLPQQNVVRHQLCAVKSTFSKKGQNKTVPVKTVYSKRIQNEAVEVKTVYPKTTQTKAVAFKSTNPNKIQNIELKGKLPMKSQTIKTVTAETPKKVLLQRRTPPKSQQPHSAPPQNQQTNFLSNIDLKPSTSPNPRLFKTRVGEKRILIPNAFYSSSPQKLQPSSEDKSNSDKIIISSVADVATGQMQSLSQEKNNCSQNIVSPLANVANCRWLNNFLIHFCSPTNIAHNTSFLLLQRVLSPEEFLKIRCQRDALTPYVGNVHVNEALLNQMRRIFYVDGNETMQKLTSIGRKFCQLAFVNILDNTISLTTDSITSEVTSRTRISAATVEAIRNSKSTSTSESKSYIDIKSLNTHLNLGNCPAQTIRLESPSVPSVRKKRGDDDIDYRPPIEVTGLATERPRRSLRKQAAKERSNSSEDNSQRFTYTETDEDLSDFTDELEYQDLSKLPPSTSAEAYVIEKRYNALLQRQKLAKSFETAFITDISKNTDPESSNNAPANIIQNPSEIHVISDDDEENSTTKTTTTSEDLIEPKVHLIHKSSGKSYAQEIVHKLTNNNETKVLRKNTNPEIHATSGHHYSCLICNMPIWRAVFHYVNSHPDNEVFISRPTPMMAQRVVNNELERAEYNRSQYGYNLYKALCIFCEKKGSFTLSDWYQHFATHTGEYPYQCSGCGLRRRRRSELTAHIQENCTAKGKMELIYQYDFNALIIMGYMCELCNFTQLHLENVFKHLKKQHGVIRIDKSKWRSVILLELPKPIILKGNQQKIIASKPTIASRPEMFYVKSSNNEVCEIAGTDTETQDTGGECNGQPVVVNEAENCDYWCDGNQ